MYLPAIVAVAPSPFVVCTACKGEMESAFILLNALDSFVFALVDYSMPDAPW
jgi:hypothetical protein